MSTTYKVRCESLGKSVTLELTQNLIGTDTWKCNDVEAWGLPEGAVVNWATDNAYLQGMGAAPVAVLYSFKRGTKEHASGKGDKSYPEGSFPSGSFDWFCESRT